VIDRRLDTWAVVLIVPFVASVAALVLWLAGSRPLGWWHVLAVIGFGVAWWTVYLTGALVAMAQGGKLPGIPITREPMRNADAALQRLIAGKVTGRIVLTADAV
jgi:hypothetical protein